MRIFIIGCSGSGKTTLAAKLAKKFKMPVYELDDLQFEKKFSVVRPKEQRRKMLRAIVRKREWIVEGSQAGWAEEAAANADIVVELKSNRPLMIVRATRRYFRRKFSANAPEENLAGLLSLCKYIWIYEHPSHKYRQQYDELMLQVKGKRVVLRSKEEIERFVAELSPPSAARNT